MLDHMGIYVKSAAVSFPFYRAVLTTLGIQMVQERFEGKANIFMRVGERFFLFLGEGGSEPRNSQPGVSPVHFGFSANSKEEVDAFHAAGLAHGGKDNGPPGHRSPTIYSAFVYDPDGNNIEAIYRLD
jgi:catechol 2,3-dioxygenase-like lactoylglutathione lyase family enzyme